MLVTRLVVKALDVLILSEVAAVLLRFVKRDACMLACILNEWLPEQLRHAAKTYQAKSK